MKNLYMTAKEFDSKEDLIERYYKLNGIEQKIVQMIAVYYVGESKGRLLKCVKKSKIKDKNGKCFNTQKFYEILDKLLKLGIITNNYSYRFSKTEYKCNSSINAFVAKEALNEGNFSYYISVSRELYTSDRFYDYYNDEYGFDYLMRELQANILLNKNKNIKNIIDICISNYSDKFFNNILLRNLLNDPFRADLFDTIAFEERIYFLRLIIYQAITGRNRVKNTDSLIEYYINQFKKFKNDSYKKDYIFDSISELFTLMLYRGDLKKFVDIFLKSNNFDDSKYKFLAVFHFLNGENEKAINEFNLALKALRKREKKQKILFTDVTDAFYILANIKSEEIVFHKVLENIVKYEEKHPTINKHIINSLYAYILALENNHEIGKEFLHPSSGYFSFFITELVKSIAYPGLLEHDKIEEFYNKTKKAGYEWLSLQVYSLGNNFKTNENKKIIYIKDMFSKQEPWKRVLKYLGGIDSLAEKDKKQDSRLIWVLKTDAIFIDREIKITEIQPITQKLGKTNKWSKGRAIAMKRLYYKEYDFLTPQDIELCNCIELSQNYYNYREEYKLNIGKALIKLSNHPFIYFKDTKTHIELIQKEPELNIENNENGSYGLSLNISEKDLTTMYEESKNRYFVYKINPTHQKIREIIGKKVNIPKEGKELLIKAISKVSPHITINTELETYYDGIENFEADNKIRVQLTPYEEGLRMHFFVRPFAKMGGYYIPGDGQKRIIKKFKDKTYQTKRDFEKEKENVNFILEACSQLSLDDNISEPFYFHNIEQSLQLMSELFEIKDSIIVEWPEGEKFKLSDKVSFDNLRLSLKSKNDWFSLSGELEIDNKKVIAFEELLEKIEKSESRFIELDNNEFLSLSKKLYTKLNEISAVTFKTKNAVQFKSPATLSVNEVINEVKNSKTDKKWKKIADGIRNAENLKINLPSTLRADLRDYQVDGYKWMMRLSQMGFGACLADDMGLGKTVQALAIILQRANLGAGLVIAPASVVHNWVKETRKFTPTLNAVVLSNDNRKNIVSELKSFDVLITTYGLLGREIELLSDKDWGTIVLDEAQFIKNMSSKRSKSAMKLKGAFKIITTGTPIENHPLEMWNLFNFINPGLFGTADLFNRRFTIPIVKDNSKEAKNKLRKIITPFILRRKKIDVLEELPQKTEITLFAEPDKDETAFYEALRRKSLKSIENNNTNEHAGQKHLKVLAELTRLRMASCHPSLIEPNINLTGAKVSLFLEIIDELIENKHKILIFSQFVKFLKIIEKEIQKREIKYQYLDGSTPLKKREQSINDFQSGVGDVFLISLKAGGLGLNLTAANYVIHLDPWWNPAVEDQASDRAHRIGQQQPVTIYRIVTKGTIEEKVLSLHKKKRELADALLEGSEISGKLSYEQLIDLIKDK